MTKTSILCVTAALTMFGAPAAAQTTKNIFVDVNFGGQFASQTFVVEGVQRSEQRVFVEPPGLRRDERIEAAGAR